MPSSLPPDWFLRSRLKLRHVQLIVAIETQRSIHKAAAQLAITQPAATKLLADLEGLLGLRLFERTTRGIIPTPHGTTLVRHSRVILGTLEHARAEMQSISAGATGKLKIGVILAVAPVMLPMALLIFKQRNPFLTVQVQESTMGQLLPRLRHGELDVVIGPLIPEDDTAGLRFEHFRESEAGMAVVVRSGHPLTRKRKLALSELAGEAWIFPTSETAYRNRIDAAFRQSGVDPPSRLIESMSTLTNATLLQKSDMLGIMPLDIAREYVKAGMLKMLAISVPPPSGPVGMITRAESLPLPSVDALLVAFRESSIALAAGS
jgi:DNA-binding transcriptional LysR family regulator